MSCLKSSLLSLVMLCTALPAMAHDLTAGATPSTALENCQALQSAGVALSGTYWIRPLGSPPRTAYCDMETNGGGWTLVYNSVLGVNTAEFWNISHWDRLGRRGSPRIESLFYEGSLYSHGRTYMDVIEDLRGKNFIVLIAEASGIDPNTMRFISPRYISGPPGIYSAQFASGWSAPDFDSDLWEQNCATTHGNVTQHYGACWHYNLGVDGDSPSYDGGVGPHMRSSIATSVGAYSDGSTYTRVRRISRFVKW